MYLKIEHLVENNRRVQPKFERFEFYHWNVSKVLPEHIPLSGMVGIR